MGYLSVPMCHGYYIEGSYRMVHWRAQVDLVLSYLTISLAYNLTNILISTFTTTITLQVRGTPISFTAVFATKASKATTAPRGLAPKETILPHITST